MPRGQSWIERIYKLLSSDPPSGTWDKSLYKAIKSISEESPIREVPTGSTDGQVLTAGASDAYTWEDAAGAEFPGGATEGQVLTADAAGDPIWADAASGGGSPGGADGELQFNDDGTFAGLSSFTYSGTAYRLTEPMEFALHSTYPNGKAEFIKITGATGAPFSTATVGTGLAFNRFTGGVVGGVYVSNGGVFTLENNTGSKITFSAGGNINLSKLSILDTGSNFYPQIRMDATSGKEVGWYVPTFGSEEMRGAVSRVDVLTLKPTGAKIKGGLNLADLPTSATGLASGDIWNDGGTLKVAP